VVHAGGRRAGPVERAAERAVQYERMFVSPGRSLPSQPARPTSRGPVDRRVLDALARQVRPTSWHGTRLLPAAAALTGLLPDGGLRRGTTIVVTGEGGGSGGDAQGDLALALALAVAPSAAGHWCAAIGLPDLGGAAVRDLGVALGRLVLVPRPGPAWPDVVAVAVEGIEVVVVRPPFPPRPGVARRLVARVREHGTILVVLPGHGGWPEGGDLRLSVAAARWEGAGDGHLKGRRMTVVASGRRAASRTRRCELWLPSPTGSVEPAGTDARGTGTGSPSAPPPPDPGDAPC